MRPALLALLLAGCGGEDTRTYEDATQLLEKVTVSGRKAGTALWDLTAEKAVLLEDTGLIRMEGVHALIFEAGKKSASIRSRQGEMDTGSRAVDLEKDVVVDSLKDSSILRTERLRYLPKEDRIRTEAPFTLERPDATIQGEGFESTPDLDEIRIFKHRTTIRK